MRMRNRMSWMMAGAVCLGVMGYAQGAVIPANEVSYTIDATTPVWAGAPDTSGDTLADGVIANPGPAFITGGSNAGWVEFAPSAVSAGTPEYALLHFDLGQSRNLSEIKIIYARGDSSGAPNPKDVQVSFSADNLTFSDPPLTFTPFNGTDNAVNTATVDLSSANAVGRYVNIRVNLNDGAWTFLTEVQFSTVPEPSGMMTGVGALVGLFLCGRPQRGRRAAACLTH